MAEKLALHEGGGQRGDIHRDKNAASPRSDRVQSARDQFFSCAALPGYKNRTAVVRQLVNDSQNALDFRRVTDQTERVSRALRRRRFLHQPSHYSPVCAGSSSTLITRGVKFSRRSFSTRALAAFKSDSWPTKTR